MIDDDNYEIPVRSIDWVFDVEEWSYEHATFFEFTLNIFFKCDD